MSSDEPGAPQVPGAHDGPVGGGPGNDDRGDANPDAPAGKDAAQRTDPASLAKEAMERARASARERGAHRTSPQAAQRQKKSRRAATAGDSSPQPFGAGRDPRAMSENVQALLSRMGWTEHIEVASVTARWREVIGDQIADHCEPVSFDEGALLLRASSSAWATQMQLMSGQVRHRLNEEFGREVVKELRFIGPSDKNWVKGPRRVKGRGPRDTYG
jgi:predicted nucleic acid-binding Zn ribbon protein